jgi:RNA polymerase sigma-70 factor (ECF subfamily)
VVEDAFVRYSGDVYRFLLRRTRSHSDAEELTQQVFADAASALSHADPPRSMRAWLYTVAERRLVDELRRRRRAVEIVAVLGPERVAHDEASDELEEAVDRLPLSQRRIVVMRIVEGRSYREIARELGCNEAACKMRLSRALRRLREDLRAAS